MAELNIDQTLALAIRHHQAGQLSEAERFYDQVLKLQPRHGDALHLMGIVAHQTGRHAVAISLIQHALKLRPIWPEALFNLAIALHANGQATDAVIALRSGVAMTPISPQICFRLANALNSLECVDDAIAAYKRTISLKADYAQAWNNLANALIDSGDACGAIAACRRAVELNPHESRYHSGLAASLFFDAGSSAQTITDEHVQWHVRHAKSLLKSGEKFVNIRTTDRRLKIGYVSGDFRDHPVGRYLLPVVENHDAAEFEIVCYSDVKVPDTVTRRFQARSLWREIATLDHETVTKVIVNDAIDILVDLGGHTRGSRLQVFARKPAPVQVTYLGYPCTTGLSAMDYRLTDHFADPPGLTDHLHVEKLIRLPRTNWCFAEYEKSPAVGNPPCFGQGGITFGSFNALAKVTDQMLQIWSEILHATPGSRLVMKSGAFCAESARERVSQSLIRRGIDRERFLLRGFEPDHASHLACYGQIDVALDTFPYHGTTTTCDALWMGVPVVTMAGLTHISRVGISLLTNVGLPELISTSPEQYINIACELVKDTDRLRILRLGLRERMLNSPLMDAPRFTREIEAAYRDMWHRWLKLEEEPGGQLA